MMRHCGVQVIVGVGADAERDVRRRGLDLGECGGGRSLLRLKIRRGFDLIDLIGLVLVAWN